MNDNVLNYINNISADEENKAAVDSYKMSDGYINRIANDYADKKKEQCMRNIVGDIYKDALPNNPDIKFTCYDDMDNFIDDRCPKGIYQYITDSGKCAISDTAEQCGKAVDEACSDMKKTLKRCVKESTMPITESDIEFAKDRADEAIGDDIEKIYSHGNFKELSEAIQSNVADAVKSSVENAKETKRANAAFEKELKNDLTVTTKESVEERLALRRNLTKRSYNLFEAMYASKSGMIMNESVDEYSSDLTMNERVMLEAVAEYTKHSVWKALKLGNYDLTTTKSLINDYLAM